MPPLPILNRVKKFLKLTSICTKFEIDKVAGFYPATLSRKENPINLFSCKPHKIFKNRFFIEALEAAASESTSQAGMILANDS